MGVIVGSCCSRHISMTDDSHPSGVGWSHENSSGGCSMLLRKAPHRVLIYVRLIFPPYPRRSSHPTLASYPSRFFPA